jgi:hypothetical protein
MFAWRRLGRDPLAADFRKGVDSVSRHRGFAVSGDRFYAERRRFRLRFGQDRGIA